MTMHDKNRYDDTDAWRRLGKQRVLNAKNRSIAIRKAHDTLRDDLKREILQKFGPPNKELQEKLRARRWLSADVWID